ncbi:striatin-interacting protein 1-like isoform X2 [Corapipo altera]|uniref:striatin-interacting protein 1-like isoform X2 n=1 Tax=Corapipo altera TaxID=415028 RepID=UPI000FD64ACE|nr:striatin-interacting protein 1-like isoform X2 [Corapipo altera]
MAAALPRLSLPLPREEGGYSESPDLEFEYADTDKWAAELSELYSYTEGPEFLLNRKCFEEDFRIHSKSFSMDLSPLGRDRDLSSWRRGA